MATNCDSCGHRTNEVRKSLDRSVCFACSYLCTISIVCGRELDWIWTFLELCISQWLCIFFFFSFLNTFLCISECVCCTALEKESGIPQIIFNVPLYINWTGQIRWCHRGAGNQNYSSPHRPVRHVTRPAKGILSPHKLFIIHSKIMLLMMCCLVLNNRLQLSTSV